MFADRRILFLIAQSGVILFLSLLSVACATPSAANNSASSDGTREMNLARIARDEGDLDAALLHLDRAVAYEPSAPEFWSARGWLYMRMRIYELAARDFEHVSRLKPNDSEPLGDLSVSLSMAGNYQRAIETIDRAIAMRDNRETEWRIRKGGVLEKLKRSFEAIDEYRIAIGDLTADMSMSDDVHEAVARLFALYFKVGDYQSARELSEDTRFADSPIVHEFSWLFGIDPSLEVGKPMPDVSITLSDSDPIGVTDAIELPLLLVPWRPTVYVEMSTGSSFRELRETLSFSDDLSVLGRLLSTPDQDLIKTNISVVSVLVDQPQGKLETWLLEERDRPWPVYRLAGDELSDGRSRSDERIVLVDEQGLVKFALLSTDALEIANALRYMTE